MESIEEVHLEIQPQWTIFSDTLEYLVLLQFASNSSKIFEKDGAVPIQHNGMVTSLKEKKSFENQRVPLVMEEKALLV